MERVFADPDTIARLRASSYSSKLQAFLDGMRAMGYTRESCEKAVRLAHSFTRWMDRRGVPRADGVGEEHVDQFLRYWGRTHVIGPGTRSTLRSFLGLFGNRSIGVAAAKSAGPAERLLEDFRRYLVEERGLAADTIRTQLRYAKALTDSCQGCVETFEPRRITAEHITKFMMDVAPKSGRRTLRVIASSLRSFLRFLAFRGIASDRLAGAVPKVAGWRFDSLPPVLTSSEVRAVLSHGGRGPAARSRNRAILLLCSRLGLRAGEVAALTIDDIRWRDGEIIIRGKGGRHVPMPLVDEVGRALASYVRDHRPRRSSRHCFLRSKAPWVPLSSRSVSCVVARAVLASGLRPTRRGAHLLRKSLAASMLRRGASLSDVGELLRHRSPHTTMVYAKVDLNALRGIARPWPTVGR